MQARINNNWQSLQVGDPVVSDRVIDSQGRFIPFTVQANHAPERTRCPIGGSLHLDLCFPYGELNDRLYADYDHRRDPPPDQHYRVSASWLV